MPAGAAEGPDRAFAERFVADMAAVFEAYGVPVTPLAVLRVEDVLACHRVVTRVEAALSEGDLFLAKESAQGVVYVAHPALEAAGKARERLRKAMRELEDACARAGAPINEGLAEKLAAMREDSDDIAGDALRFESKRDTKSKAS
jgi:hypothetical protein